MPSAWAKFRNFIFYYTFAQFLLFGFAGAAYVAHKKKKHKESQLLLEEDTDVEESVTSYDSHSEYEQDLTVSKTPKKRPRLFAEHDTLLLFE